ncbi:hypothetical protein IFR35_22780 [Pseudomonas fluorescens]|uniref:hypothetical protein n=1 Tax=Pseudomonas fluorescens TaxID=294 RepID=UPI00177DB10D|nr:hypothetical protein [Pseudomonas fluorescens]MBD8194226.1 hypothetical protein [Pseudomonas fluorescens]MBD8228965.1 hypothetical protein [Pseudomonas fluorescens]MBD8787036.1 hypothetical protein [Pseudomonas fluorescens]MBD8819130.1 hypothetical protein [Pseudomonas fluorescens]
MNKKLTMEDIDNAFSDAVTRLFLTMHFTLSARIVRSRIDELDQLVLVYKNYKRQAIKRADEYHANCFFYMQCVLSCTRALYLVFEYVKKEDNSKAWGALIDAYDYIDIAAKAGKVTNVPPGEDGILGTTKIRGDIEKIESVLFPSHGKYNSPGLVESIGECSVCNQSFLECEHVEGEIYMGAFCQRINREFYEFEHFALVDYPRDRRCIFTSRHDKEGVAVDCFSGEPLKEKIDADTFQGILFYFGGLDLE